MSNQLQITGGAKVRSLEGVITGTSGVLGALGINVPSGIPQLDTNGKILVSQLPNSVMEYKGTWDASTNTPTLANGTGNQGDVYLCSAAGTVNFGAGPITFAVGDQVIYSGTIWQKAGGATGSVTSVAITESGDALTITGSPITTSGTINIGFAGTTGQYVNGAGGLTTFPSLTGYVPYTGATTDVDLGVYVLNAQALHVKGTAGAGHLGLKHQSAAATGSANESLIYANVDGDLAWQNDNLNLTTLSTHANTANRVYTFPDLTGTMAMLEGTQTFTGDKTFTASVNNDDGLKIKLGSASNLTAGYLTLSAYGETTPLPDRTILRIGTSATQISLFKLQNTGSYTYDFPASSGTIALTSNLSSYVPYTGATSDVNLGTTYSLSANNITAAGVVKSDFGLQLKSGLTTTISGYLSISAQKVSTNSQLNVYTDTGFYFSLIAPNTANYSYTYPASSGTLVLGTGTTNYLPKFTGTSTIGNSMLTDDGTTLQSIGATRSNLYLKAASSSYYSQLAFTNGTNGSFGGISYNNSGQYMQFETNSSEWMRLTSDGKLGIGTTSPASILHAIGAIRSSNAGNTISTRIESDGLYTAGSDMYIVGGTSNIIFYSTSERMRITSAGYVGIGTTNPTRQLFVNSTAFFDNNGDGSTTNPSIAIGSTNVGLSYIGGGNLALLTGGTERMRISSSGNVGIGTSSPYKLLTITKGVGGTVVGQSELIRIAGTEQAVGNKNEIGFANYANNYNASVAIGAVTTSTSGYLIQDFYIATRDSSSDVAPTERMRITSGGKLCVGSTSTIFSSSGNNITAAVSAGGEAVLEVSNNSSSDSSPAINCFKTSTTTSSAARFIQFYSQNGSIAMGGIVGNGSTNVQFASISDIREKENITTINGSLDKILALNPVEYDWIKTKEHIKAGFVAQEVEQIFPEYVVENMSNDGEEERKGLTGGMSSGIIAHLVKAIQELNAKVTALENK